ncbi:RrF2 family transcriptional regulator [Balneola sp. MJW-20]|uniref:RrF2 family transcriptional regulator n=1 Tax=Gracilimonas aurantiaca TaxID=3234185 RepID=UPI003467264D
MMFSTSTQYAIRAIVFMARNKSDRKFRAAEVADELDIPTPYLSKVLQRLARNGIVSSSKGPGGGFFVDDSNLKMRMIDVITTMEGPRIFNKCILGLDSCNEKNPCFLHEEYTQIKKILDKPLYEKDFEDLINQYE